MRFLVRTIFNKEGDRERNYHCGNCDKRVNDFCVVHIRLYEARFIKFRF